MSEYEFYIDAQGNRWPTVPETGTPPFVVDQRDIDDWNDAGGFYFDTVAPWWVEA